MYILQINGDCLNHKIDDYSYKSPTKVTFIDDGRFDYKREIVTPSAKSPSVVGDFDHLVTYTLTYTIEESNGCTLGCEYLMFGSLDGAKKEMQHRGASNMWCSSRNNQ